MKVHKILIVEDDLFLRELYTDILSSELRAVETAEDGKIGLEKILSGGWDLVLLDMNLPKMTGVEIVKQLQKKQEPKLIQNILFLTNMEEGPAIEEIQAMGYSFLIKSRLSPDQFLQKIEAYLT